MIPPSNRHVELTQLCSRAGSLMRHHRWAKPVDIEMDFACWADVDTMLAWSRPTHGEGIELIFGYFGCTPCLSGSAEHIAPSCCFPASSPSPEETGAWERHDMAVPSEYFYISIWLTIYINYKTNRTHNHWQVFDRISTRNISLAVWIYVQTRRITQP